MNEWSASKRPNRAQEVWERLSGCFGDALERKFGNSPPDEWRAAIGSLSDYDIDRGIRRLIYSGKTHPPSLPEFMKLCRTVGHADDVPDRIVHQMHPALEGPQMGPWELLGNRRLLKYITTKVPANPSRYGDPRNNGADPKFRANVLTLVAHKNRWVDVMLASATDDGVPIVEQDDCWNACMSQAEEIIANAS